MFRFGIRDLSAIFGLGLASLSTSAAAQTWSATMNGANESPVNASPGTGFALLSYDAMARTLTISATFSGLTGTTTVAHLHCCTAVALAGTAGVASMTPTFLNFPPGVTSGTYNIVLNLDATGSYNPAFVTANGGTAATAQAALVAGMNAGKVYFNIHSNVFPGGEIRGFTTVVPEPSTVVLLASGLVVIGFMTRRRRGIGFVPEA